MRVSRSDTVLVNTPTLQQLWMLHYFQEMSVVVTESMANAQHHRPSTQSCIPRCDPIFVTPRTRLALEEPGTAL